MNLELNGKVAIVTGASRGIGLTIEETVAAEGARLVLAARRKAALEAVARQCGGDALVVDIDLRLPEAPQHLVEAAVAHFGRLDILVNNAGATKRGDFLALSEEDWQDGF